MSRFLRSRFPIIASTILILDGSVRELFIGGIIKARYIHCVEFSIEWRHFKKALTEWPHPALLTEIVVYVSFGPFGWRGLVIRKRAISLQQTELILEGEDFPEPRLRTKTAVASPGSCSQIDIALKSDRSAVATACVGLLHGSL